MTRDRHAPPPPRTDAPPPLRARPPKALLVDLFHTIVLVRPDEGPDGRPRYTWDELGLPRDVWESALYADAPGRALGHVRDAVEGMRLLAHGIDPAIPLERIERAARGRKARFDRDVAAPEPEVVEALTRLRAAGHRLVLVSNAAFDEIDAWERSPLAGVFHHAVFSCAVGVAKPDRRIYEIALGHAGVAAEDALFVGDGGSDEHRGARDAGIRTAIVTRHAARWWPHAMERRRAAADHAFDDVPALAAHLLGDAP